MQNEPNIHAVLGIFVNDAKAFRQVLRDTGAVLWGPPIVDLLRGEHTTAKELTIFVPPDPPDALAKLKYAFDENGYTWFAGAQPVFQRGELHFWIQMVPEGEAERWGLSLESLVLQTSMSTAGACFMTWEYAVGVYPTLLDRRICMGLVAPAESPERAKAGMLKETRSFQRTGFRLPEKDDPAWDLQEVMQDRKLGDEHCRVIRFGEDGQGVAAPYEQRGGALLLVYRGLLAD